ncbi:hypothetical protein DMENIID0001_071690 [Sergentomyia squamirostris]
MKAKNRCESRDGDMINSQWTVEDITDQATLVSDPKAKEWLVSAARCNYQELSKLASERPWLVKLQQHLVRMNFGIDISLWRQESYHAREISLFSQSHFWSMQHNVHEAV